MRKLLLLMFIVSLPVLFAEESMKIEIGNVSIESPLGWFAQYTKSPSLFILYSPLVENDTFQENCNLTTEILYTNFSVEEYINASLETLTAMYTDFNIVTREKNYYIFMGNISNIDLKQMQYVYIKKNVAYVLTFSSIPSDFDKYVDIFKQIAASFKIN